MPVSASDSVYCLPMLTHVSEILSYAELTRRTYAGETLRFRGMEPLNYLIELTAAFCEDALAPVHPTLIHDVLNASEQIERLTELQAGYTRHTEIRQAWAEAFQALGMDVSDTASDRLRLRFQTHHNDEMTRRGDTATGSLPLHRDTWGSNLYAQINWWAPVYTISAARTMALYPSAWNQALQNSSAEFDLPDVVQRRRDGGYSGVSVAEVVPRLTESVDAGQAVPVEIEPGELIAFSGAHLHGSIANRTGLTRVSIETRTVRINDVIAGRGAPNVDGESAWMGPGWFHRISDQENLADILGLGRICAYSDQAQV